MGRQYKTIAIMAIVLAAILYAGYRFYPLTAPLATKVVISFVIEAGNQGWPASEWASTRPLSASMTT